MSTETVLVTGATGGIGSWLVDSLVEEYEVVGVDLERPEEKPRGTQFYAADLTDQGAAWDLVASVDPDAVVHLAGIPRLGIRPDAETFFTNVESTYHVLHAAGRQGARVVWTSSETTYGTMFAEEPWVPDYLPLDEDHDLRPEDAYGGSKVVGEEVAKMVTRKHGVPVTSVRPSWVQYPGDYSTPRAIREGFDPEDAHPLGNYWSYVDVRDVVSVVEAALEVEIEGHEAFLAVADENFLGRPTAECVEAVFGHLPAECDLEGEQSALSNAKARDLLDWEPAHDWRSAEEESVEGPAVR